MTLRSIGLALLAWLQTATAQATEGQQVRYRCEAIYLPARSTWVRSVEIEHDDRRVRALRIDGVAVYSFAVDGAVLRTALDNERITFDTARLSWQSDLRGLASSQGRCERED